MKKVLLSVVILSCFWSLDVVAQRTIGNSRGSEGGHSSGGRNPNGRSSESRPAETPPPPPLPAPNHDYVERPSPRPIHPCPQPVFVDAPVILPQPVIVIVQEEEKPEPEEVVLHDTATKPGKSGFDFSAAEIVDWRDESTDMFISSCSEGPEFVVRKDADIQDLGQVVPFFRLETVPLSEWSPAHRVNAEVRNVYVVWTWDNQYFKLRVISVSDGRVSFEWMKMEGGSRVASSVLHRNGEIRRDNTLAKFGR